MFACIYIPTDRAFGSLTEFAYGFSPIVEETSSDTVVLDVSGCELLFGSEYQLTTEIFDRAQKPANEGGLAGKVNVALAANPDAAIHAAKNLKGITFISPGEELGCLGTLSIRLLEHSLVQVDLKQAEEIFETLRLWGIHSFSDFASLPTAGVAERIGQAGVSLQQLARGKIERHLHLKQPAPVFASAIELEHAIAELEPLSFVFARLLNQLCATLNAYALATNELLIEMKLVDQTLHERRLTLPYAMRDHKVFLKLLLLDIEMHPPQTAVNGVAISCDPVKPRLLQNGLFTPLAPEPEKLELTLARIAKLVGQENVGSPALVDTHRPDAFSIKRFVVKGLAKINRRFATKTPKSEFTNPNSIVGFRMFRPALRAVVQTDQGVPKQISAWDKQRSVYGRIVNLAGPWRTTGDWWRDDRWARDEWDVAIKTGSGIQSSQLDGDRPEALYRIYRELGSGTWFVEGSYD
jgi:protein ImuB